MASVDEHTRDRVFEEMYILFEDHEKCFIDALTVGRGLGRSCSVLWCVVWNRHYTGTADT